MSCPSSLQSAGRLFDNADEEPVNLPNEYYVYTVLMISLVLGIPLIYRQLWVSIWSTVSYYRRPRDLRDGPLGCWQLGRLGDRNLSSEYSNREKSNGHAAGGSGKVEALFVYPIKSCYPVELQKSEITETGLEFDRQFCFASWHQPTAAQQTAKNNGPKKGSSAWWDGVPHWEFLTQRQNPSLTHLKIQIWRPDPKLREYDEDSDIVKRGGSLIVSFAFMPPLDSIANIWSVVCAKVKAFNISATPIWHFEVPLKPSREQIEAKAYGTETVRVWRDEVDGLDMTSEIPPAVLRSLQLLFLQDVKQRSLHKYNQIKDAIPELRLFRIDDTKSRNVYKCAPNLSQLGYQAHTDFQDSYPIHIQNTATIADVEANIPSGKAFNPDSRRFRANIYVSGSAAYDEDDWTLIDVGGHKLHVSCRTTRCKLPTNDPDTGVLGSDVQPYKYLGQHRAIDEGAPQSGCLGMMLVPTKEAVGATIEVGDDLAILKRGRHFFIADAEPEAQRPVF